jgi:hypothetical protein
MRTVTLVLALTAACAASPALGQARILTVQDQTQVLDQAPLAAPAPDQNRTPPAASPQAPAMTPVQPSPQAPPQAQMPAQGQEHPKEQSGTQNESQAKRQDRALPEVTSRYSFTRVDNGFLRLDHKSGNVAYCTSYTAGWSCEAVPENRASLEQQIAQLRDEVADLQHLRDEVAELKREIATRLPPRLRPPETVPPSPPPAPPPPPPADQRGGITFTLPNQQDIARARGFITDTWHRLVDMIENLRKDMMRKG